MNPPPQMVYIRIGFGESIVAKVGSILSKKAEMSNGYHRHERFIVREDGSFDLTDTLDVPSGTPCVFCLDEETLENGRK